MLKSRTLADKLIAQFDLKKVYGVDTLEQARKKLEDRTEILAGKDGLISIVVEDRDHATDAHRETTDVHSEGRDQRFRYTIAA